MRNKSEIKQTNPKQAEQQRTKPKHDPNKFKAGDKVVVYRKFDLDDEPEGWNNSWVSSMDEYVGNEYIVDDVYGSSGVYLDVPSGDCYFAFPSGALALVQTAEEIAEEKAAKHKESVQFTDQELQLIKLLLQNALRHLNSEITLAKESATLAFDVCDPERKNNPYVMAAYKELNHSKKYIRYASKKIKALSSAQNKVKFLLGNKK